MNILAMFIFNFYNVLIANAMWKLLLLRSSLHMQRTFNSTNVELVFSEVFRVPFAPQILQEYWKTIQCYLVPSGYLSRVSCAGILVASKRFSLIPEGHIGFVYCC